MLTQGILLSPKLQSTILRPGVQIRRGKHTLQIEALLRGYLDEYKFTFAGVRAVCVREKAVFLMPWLEATERSRQIGG
jgi:hypothetical protein